VRAAARGAAMWGAAVCSAGCWEGLQASTGPAGTAAGQPDERGSSPRDGKQGIDSGKWLPATHPCRWGRHPTGSRRRQHRTRPPSPGGIRPRPGSKRSCRTHGRGGGRGMKAHEMEEAQSQHGAEVMP
jgi:hypothetical protein